MGAQTISITVSDNTLNIGNNRKHGLDVHAWADNIENVYVSPNGDDRIQNTILKINDSNVATYKIMDVAYTTIHEWLAAFNKMIATYTTTGHTSYPNNIFGDKLTVGTTKARVLDVAYPGWITIKADSDNADSLWVADSNVADEDGFLLAAGDEHTWEHDSLRDLYIIGGAADQVYYITGSYKS